MQTTLRNKSGRITKIVRRDANGRILPAAWKGPYQTGSKAKGRRWFNATGGRIKRAEFLKRSRGHVQMNPQLLTHLPITHNRLLLDAKSQLLWDLNRENAGLTREEFDALIETAEDQLWNAKFFRFLLDEIGARLEIPELYRNLRALGEAA